MTSRLIRFAFAATLAAAAFPAAAVTVAFDTTPGGATIADGTLIGSQYTSVGVTFSAVDGANTSLLPVATSFSAGPAGPNYSGNYLGNSNNGAPGNSRYDIVRLTFNGGTASALSLSLNNFSLVGTTTFNAYNSSGLLIETFVTNAGNGWDRRSLLSSGIARLDLLNNTFNGSELFYGIDQLTFTLTPAAGVIPEPASWALMIGGFAMAGGALRRRAVRVAVAG